MKFDEYESCQTPVPLTLLKGGRDLETVKIAEVTRGDLVESVHRGVLVLVDTQGQIIASAGDPSYLTYFRSAAKPLQALPILESGAAAYFSLNLKEIAILAGSHSGAEEHVVMVEAILRKISLTMENLQCGVHWPIATTLHCTCSGKHAGMLVLARYRGYSLEEYYCCEHPVQKEMLTIVAEMTGMKADEIPLGIDGCGVPVFAVPLWRMAYAYARLAQPEGLTAQRREACLQIRRAMVSHPVMVAGRNRFDTVLMEVTRGKMIAKFGAEGVYCLGIPEKGWGIALKVADGNERALALVILSVLDQLGLLTAEENKQLRKYYPRELKNNRDEIVGEIRSVLTLRKKVSGGRGFDKSSQ